MEREIANVVKASGLRNFRYIAFPAVVFDAPPRAVPEQAALPPEPVAGEPELVLAPENAPPAPPEPMPALAPEPTAAVPPPPALAAPAPIPDPPSWSQPVRPPEGAAPPLPPAARPPAGLRLLADAAAAAAPSPPPKPPESPRRFALLDDIQTEMRPRRPRTGRRRPGELL